MGNEVGVMHACGHDAHVAILMGVAEWFDKNKDFQVQLGSIACSFFNAYLHKIYSTEERNAVKNDVKENVERYNPEVIFGLHVIHHMVMLDLHLQ